MRDFSAKTKTAYILPYKFTKPQKLNKSLYRVEMEAVNVNGIYYPVEVFSSIQMVGGELVYIINYDYESLGKCYHLLDGDMLCAIKGGEEIPEIEMLQFNIDTKNKTYEQVDLEKEKQPGEE